MEEEEKSLSDELSDRCMHSYLIKSNNRYIAKCEGEKGTNKLNPFLFLGESCACVATEIYPINSTPHTKISLDNINACPYRNYQD
ncbi:MAG: hypothetical protein WC511_00325 [Candidatus Pacearchaeota archaeon]